MIDSRISIQQAMRAAFPAYPEQVAPFYGMQEYQLSWRNPQLQPVNEDPGKLVRPQLVLLACQAVGGQGEQALPLAAGIQLVHDFSLIHDDIEDNSDTRRGRPTVWTVWGLAHGINAGDGMFVLAHRALHQLVDVGVPPERALAILRRFDETILTICEGQYLDLSFEGNLEIREDDYLGMIARKTAALIGASTELGAMVGGADDTTAAAFQTFGTSLGLAFQIQDDVLGIWGDPARTGKPAAADLYRRKLSLPVVYTLQGEHGAALARLYRDEPMDEQRVAIVLELLNRAGARAYTEQMSATYHQQAVSALERVQGQPEALAQLRAIMQGLIGRTR